MVKKSIFISLFLIVLIVFAIYWLKPPVSLGTIEGHLSSKTLSKHEIKNQLNNLFQFIEGYQLSRTEISQIDSSIADKSFLAKQDSSVIKKISAFKNDSSVENDSLYFFSNRLSLYGLFFNILNNDISLKHKLQNYKFSEEGNIEAAVWISQQFDKHLNLNLLKSQVQFYLDLEPKHVKSKLEVEQMNSKAYNLLFHDPKGALNYIGACLRKTKKMKDKKRELEILAKLHYVLYESYGLTSTALALGNYLLDESNKFGHSINSALVYYYNGNALIDKGLFQDALKQFESALLIYSKFGFDNMIIRMYERMGVVNRRLGKFNLALEFYKKIFTLEKQTNESTARMYYLLGIGLVQWEMGLYSEAEKSYSEGLRIARSLNDKQNKTTALINLGVLFNDLGDASQAETYLINALKILELEEVPHTTAEIWMFLTEVYITNNEVNKAKVSAANAIKYLSRHDFGMLNARNYIHIGKLQLQIGDFEHALQSFSHGLRLFEKIEVLVGQVESLNYLGEVHRRMNNYSAGLKLLDEALAIESQFPQIAHEWNTYFILANIYRDLNQIQKAESYYEKSISFVKNVASQLNNNEQRSNFSQKIQPVFENMVVLQYNMNDKKKALFFAEQERAQVFNILLQDNSDKEPTPVVQKSGLSLNQTSPDNYNQTFLSDLQTNLNSKTVAVEYEMTDSSLVIWVIGHETLEAVEVKINRSTLDNLIAEFRECINLQNFKSDSLIKNSYELTKTLGKQLYDYLIAPIEDYISYAEYIYFIPDETLHYIPFATLRNSKDEYLISDYAIAYIPSADILEQRLQKAVRKKEVTLKDKHLLTVASNLDLIEAIQEAKEVAGLLSNSNSLIGLEASELALRNKLEDDVNILLFSNHSNIDEKKPYYSALLLSKDSTVVESSENDGFLTVQEIQQLDLNVTELVYLASCESASGKLYKGEGIVGMQRAFMISGANSVIANLWKIEDKSTKALTVDFFKLWLSGKHNKAEALREAQLKMIKSMQKYPKYDKQSHPFFWASVKLTGTYN